MGLTSFLFAGEIEVGDTLNDKWINFYNGGRLCGWVMKLMHFVFSVANGMIDELIITKPTTAINVYVLAFPFLADI